MYFIIVLERDVLEREGLHGAVLVHLAKRLEVAVLNLHYHGEGL